MMRYLRALRRLLGRPEGFFVVIALLFGLPILLLRPGYDVPDFGTHLARAYDISQGKLLPQTLDSNKVFNTQIAFSVPKTGYKQVGGYLPRDVAKLTDTFTPNYAWARYKVSATDQFKLYRQPRDLTPVAVQYNTVGVYNPLSYAPQAVSLLLARIAHLSLYAGILLASAVSFVLWLLAVFWAIKVAPIGKWAIVTLALLPMTIFQAPSISPDPLLFACIILFFAYLMTAFKKQRLVRRDVVIISLLTASLAVFKQTYFILALATAAVYFTKLPKADKWRLLIWSIVPPFLITLVWAVVIQKLNFSIAPWSQPTQQIHGAIVHPAGMIQAVVGSLLMHSDQLLWSFFGVLGWLTIPIPLLCVIALAFALFLALCLDDTNALQLTRNSRLVLGLVLLANILLILAALYAYWTPVGGSLLGGLMGRYFVPLAIFASPLLLGVRLEGRRQAISIIGTVIVGSLLITMFILTKTYYLA